MRALSKKLPQQQDREVFEDKTRPDYMSVQAI